MHKIQHANHNPQQKHHDKHRIKHNKAIGIRIVGERKAITHTHRKKLKRKSVRKHAAIKHRIHHMKNTPLIIPSDKDERNQDMRSKKDKKPNKKRLAYASQQKNLKNVPTLDLRNERDIAMDFATKIYQRFNKLVKSVVLFGSTAKQSNVPGSDIDIIILGPILLWRRQVLLSRQCRFPSYFPVLQSNQREQLTSQSC